MKAGSQEVGLHIKRLLKNVHLRRSPAASPSRRRGKKLLVICCDTTPYHCLCQARGSLVEEYTCRERFETVPYEGFRVPPRAGFHKDQLASGHF